MTERDCGILRPVVAGSPNKNIADLLGISASIVKPHLHQIFAKMSVQERTSAIVAALRCGLVSIPADSSRLET